MKTKIKYKIITSLIASLGLVLAGISTTFGEGNTTDEFLIPKEDEYITSIRKPEDIVQQISPEVITEDVILNEENKKESFLNSIITKTFAQDVINSGQKVLLLQDYLPWNSTANETLLKELEIPYDLLNSDTFIGLENLDKYKSIIIASDQTFLFYDNIKSKKILIEKFVNEGGLLVVHSSDKGWNTGDSNNILPGGITKTFSYIDYPSIVNSNHPILTGTGGGINLSQNSTYFQRWGYAAHGYFQNININIDTLLNYLDKPVYIDYVFGKGRVISSLQTLEFGYAYRNKKDLLKNEFIYIKNFKKYTLPFTFPELSVQKSPDSFVNSLGTFSGIIEKNDVNFVNGNFGYKKNVVHLGGIGMNFDFGLYYNNQAIYNGPLGYNWNHNYNIFLKKLDDGNIEIFNGELSSLIFKKNENSQEYVNSYTNIKIVENDKKYILTLPNKTQYFFSEFGKITEITDKNLNKLIFTYDEDFKLIKITDTLSKDIIFTYQEDRLSQISSYDGQQIDFIYYGENEETGNFGDLKNIKISKSTNPENNKTITFTYTKIKAELSDKENQKFAHNILNITDSKSQVYIENTYDSEDRVISQKYGDGIIKYEFNTGVEFPKIKVTDKNGSIINYTFDKNGNVLEKEIGSTITKYTYTSSGRLLTTILPKGNGTKYSYDDNGNVTEVRKKGLISLEDNDLEDLVTKYTYETNFNNISEIIYPNGTRVNFEFDGKGNIISRLQKISEEKINITKFEYNDKGQLIKQIDNSGIVTTFEYIGGNLIVKTVIGDNGTALATKYEYDINNNLIKVIDPNGNEKTFEYSDFRNLIKGITAEGIITNYTYDNNDNLLNKKININSQDQIKTEYEYSLLDSQTKIIQDINKDNKSITNSVYDPNGNLIKQDKDGIIKEYKYNEFGKISEAKIGSLTNLFTYDSNGNLTKTINPKGIETTYEYDNFDRLNKEIDLNGTYKLYSYDKASNIILKQIFSNNNKLLSQVKNTYDLDNKLIKKIDGINNNDSLNQATTHTYNNLSQLTQSTDPKGNKTTYTYDEFGRNKEIIDAKGNKQVFTYDKLGNIIQKDIIQSNGKTNTTKYSYDKDGRLITSSVIASGSEANHNTFKYNNLNQITEKKDGNGNITNFEYDYVGNITKKIEYLKDTANQSGSTNSVIKQVITKYSYDLNGNITKITDPNGNETKYSYDELNRLVKTIYSDNSELVYTYDELNNLITQKDPNGTITTNTYDNLNRLIERNITLGTGVEGVTKETYEYDELGRLIKSTDNLGTILKFSYDEFGRLTSEDQNGKIVSYDYDLNSNLTNSTYPSGRKVNRSYDELGRLLSIKDGESSIATYSYDGLEEKELTYGNNTKTIYEYDNFGRLSKLSSMGIQDMHNWKTRKFDNKPLIIDEYNYTYDNLDNIISNGKDNFVYDELGRIINVNYSTNIEKIKNLESFQYDNAGNIITSQKGIKINLINGKVNKNDNFRSDISKLDLVRIDEDDDDEDNNESYSNYTENSIKSKIEGKINNLEIKNYEVNNLNLYTKIENKLNFQKFSSKIIGQSFQYDKNGNLKDDSKKRYYYDYKNRLVRVEKYSKYEERVGKNKEKVTKEKVETIISFKYDTLGRITNKETKNENTKYTYSNDNIIEEKATIKFGKISLNKNIKEYIYGNKGNNDLLQLQLKNDKLRINKLYYYNKDNKGNIISITDDKGRVVEKYRYSVQGKTFISLGNSNIYIPFSISIIDNDRLFLGEQYNKEIKLYNNYGKFYSSDLGRLINRDFK